jgi:hypothetical protein
VFFRVGTIGIEHEDPKRILAALRTPGLNSHANINYWLGFRCALVSRATTEQQKGSGLA